MNLHEAMLYKHVFGDGGGGVESDFAIVHITINPVTFSVALDKTFDELMALKNAGKFVIGLCTGIGTQSLICECDSVLFDGNTRLVFNAYYREVDQRYNYFFQLSESGVSAFGIGHEYKQEITYVDGDGQEHTINVMTYELVM